MKITKKTVEVFVDDNGGEHETMHGAIRASYRTLLSEIAKTKDQIAIDRLLERAIHVRDLFTAYIDAADIVALKDLAKKAKTDANGKLAPSDDSGATVTIKPTDGAPLDEEYAGTTAHGV